MNAILSHGSTNDVLAPFEKPGEYIYGKQIRVKVIGVDEGDTEIPMIVREALVGLTVETIFTREKILAQCDHKRFSAILPPGCILAYAKNVVAALSAANKHKAAKALKEAAEEDLDMYVLTAGTYEIVSEG